MKILFLSLLVALGLSPIAHAQQAWLPGDILVMVKPGASATAIANDLSILNGEPTHLRVVEELSAPMRVWHLHYDNASLPEPVMLRAVQAHPATQLAQLNHIVKDRALPNDTDYGNQWHHQNIDSEAAWDITTGGVTALGDSIVVCIIENADLPHPDLIGNAWYNFQEIPNNSLDDDANGYVDDFEGWNPGANNDNVYGGGHGTQVAGMIGAKGDNNLGVAGANWDVKMMVVTRQGVGEAQVIQSYTYPLVMRRLYNQTAGGKGAFVVATNASWGIDNADPTDYPLWCAIYDTLGTAGVLNCGATANNNVDIDAVGDMPTGCSSDFMISVTATNNVDQRTFSGYGLTTVDLGAPGEDVYTTTMGGGYGSTSGTSFASPLTAGVIALICSSPCTDLANLMQADPEAGALYVRQALFNGVEQVGNLPGQTVTGGRINAGNSVQWIMGNCGSCPVPYSLSATNTGLGEASLGWNALGASVYNVQVRPVGGGAWTPYNNLVNNSLAINGLTNCTEYEFQIEALCDTSTSGFSQSFVWTTDGCCTAPLSVSAAANDAISATATWSNVLVAGTYDLRYRVQGSATWTTLTGLTGTSTAINGLDSCTAYELEMSSSCNGSPSPWGPTTTFSTVGCGACIDNTYCPSVSDDATAEWITNVTVGTINNTSGSDDGYGNYTGQNTTFFIGQSYPISLEPDFSSFPYDEWWHVYIDLDQDGQFTTTDLVFDGGGLTTATETGLLTVPATALPGPTRMRVVMKYNGEPVDGCEDGYSYGETEDYCVTLNSSVGLTDLVNGTTVSVFPDPADRDIFFDITGPYASGQLTIDVLDNSGRLVARKAVQHGRATITTAWLEDGMYFFSLKQGADELKRGKFTVLHGLY